MSKRFVLYAALISTALMACAPSGQKIRKVVMVLPTIDVPPQAAKPVGKPSQPQRKEKHKAQSVIIPGPLE